MRDVKIIAIKDVLPITGAQVLPGVVPASLEIRGNLFRQATEVIINERAVPEFVVLSDSRIWAQIPDGQEIISTVVVLAEQPSADRSSIFHFEAGKTFRALQGLERLVQLFAKLAMQTPGTDKFRPELGGGLLALAGQNVSRHSNAALSASAVSAISRTREQIIALQNRTLRTPPDERLLTANVEGVRFDAPTTTFAIRVSITAQSGRTAVANLTF